MEGSLSSPKTRSMGKENGPFSSKANPLLVYSSRSKSRMSFHSNPSRSDPVPCKPTAATESVEAFLGLSCSDASRLSSIKDLRMKRIFTPEIDSVPQQGMEEGENEERKKLKVAPGAVNELKVEDEPNDIANALNSKDLETSGNGSHTIGKMALNRCNSRKLFKNAGSFSYRRMLPYLMDIANDASCVSKIEIVDGVSSGVRSTDALKIEGDDLKPSENGVDASMEEEEHIQMTPPEPGMLAKMPFDHGAESLEANKFLSENQTLMGLSIGSAKSSADALKQSPNAKCNTNSMDRSVLNPCSRLRLFNNSRSVSYRRMLPFLMDISKDSSCASTNTQHPNLQKSDLVKDNVNKNKEENSSEKHSTQDLTTSTAPLPPLGNSSLDTNDVLVASMSDSSELESNIATSETRREEIPQTQSSPAKSELGRELKDTTSQSEQSSIDNINDDLIKEGASEEPESVGNQKMSLDMGLVLNAESIERVHLNQNLFQVKASSDVIVCPNNRLTKGILKRNPLGCRGLCNCLNCASFRLHADRAFEFSRNQMHSAEEVASGLMEELANLRILLEKSITQNDDFAGIQLNPDHVKQACNKALETEKMAKERLIELNNDLGAHCRIPALVQPKVTFATNIQERAIQAMDPSTSTDEEC